jgi:hypothetical protein
MQRDFQSMMGVRLMDITKPKRVTVPEGSVAIIVPQQLAEELASLAFHVRLVRRASPEDRMAMYNIAGDLLISLLDAGVNVLARKPK